MPRLDSKNRRASFAFLSRSFGVIALAFLTILILLPALASAQSKIFWNEQIASPATDTIYSANLDGTSPQKLFLLGNLGRVRGLAVDPLNQKIYWSDSTNFRIRCGNFDGSGVETVIGSLASTPGNLSLDVAAEKMYWISEEPNNEILRANFDGTGLETLESLEAGKLCLALDLTNSKMYWATVIAGSGKIRRTNLDGTGLVAITSGLGTVTSLGLDLSGGKLYWVDQGLAEIHRANLDGSGAELLVTATALPHSISLDVDGGKMYWSDLDDGNLFRANLDGSSVETLTSAMPNRPEFIGLYVAETSTFAGMSNTALGSASMSLDLNNDLVISNLGPSGNDGVSFALGQAQFGVADLATLSLSPGAFVQASAIGSLNNTPGQTLGTITLTGTSGGNTNIQFDLSVVSGAGPDMIVYNGATQVFLGTVPGNSVEVAGGMGPDMFPFLPQGANAAAEIKLNQKLAISIPGGPTLTGDRIVALVENVAVLPDYISEISVTGGGGLSAFTLEAEELGQFGFPHEAAGAAQITALPGQVTVSSAGPDALAGVAINVGEAGSAGPDYLVELAAVPLSGVNEQVHFAASQAPDALPFGSVDLLATGSGFDVNIDYSAIGASMVNVQVFNQGVLMGTATVPSGTVGTITAASNPIALTRTFVEAAGHVAPCFLVGFQNPVGFAPVTSNQLSVSSNQLSVSSGSSSWQSSVNSNQSSVNSDQLSVRSGSSSWQTQDPKSATATATATGDEIHFHAVNPTISVSGIGSVTLQMANVPEFTIINEATEQAPLPSRVLLANGWIEIDRNVNSEGEIHSNTKVTFHKGAPGTHKGNVTAVGDVVVEGSNTIQGSAIAGDDLYLQGNPTITGVAQDHQSIISVPLPTLSFTAGGPNKTVPKNGSLSLPPGKYGKVTVKAGGTLNLSPGDYFLNSLSTEKNARIAIEVSERVRINIVQTCNLGNSTKFSTSAGELGSVNVELNYLATAKLQAGASAVVLGTITAPNAQVHFSQNAKLRGAIIAESISFDNNVIFLHHNSTQSLPRNSESETDDSETSDQSPVTTYQLEQNYPNPFNPSTVIGFQLPEESEVSLVIYNLNGQVVKQIARGKYASGKHEVVWDGRNETGLRVASGVYVYVLKAGSFVSKKKLVLMK